MPVFPGPGKRDWFRGGVGDAPAQRLRLTVKAVEFDRGDFQGARNRVPEFAHQVLEGGDGQQFLTQAMNAADGAARGLTLPPVESTAAELVRPPELDLYR